MISAYAPQPFEQIKTAGISILAANAAAEGRVLFQKKQF